MIRQDEGKSAPFRWRRSIVIAAGGISDARGIAAAAMLGATAVQIGTAYLFCHEVTISAPHRQALSGPEAESTALTNVFTGRPATV